MSQIHRRTVTTENSSLSYTDVRAGSFDALGRRSLRKKKNTGARPGTGNRLLDDSWSGNGHYHEIRAASSGKVFDFGGDVHVSRIPRQLRAAAGSEREPLGNRIGGGNPCARAPHQHGEHEADGALAQHHHELIWLRIGLHNSFEAGVPPLAPRGAPKTVRTGGSR